MEDGLILKYTTLKDWPDYLKANPYSSTCQLVTKNGKVKLNTFILAALSPFLEQLLSTLPPFIDSCIILPDIEWTDLSPFLESLSKSSDNLLLTKSLARILGINLNNFTEVSLSSQTKTKGKVYDLINIDDDDIIEEGESDQDHPKQAETLISIKTEFEDNSNDIDDTIKSEKSFVTTNNDINNQEILDNMFSTIFDLGNENNETLDDYESVLGNKKRQAVEMLSNHQEYETINPTKKTKINDLNEKQTIKKIFNSVHLNPEWLPNLRKNFKEEIIDNCSTKVKIAFEENKKLENVKERREVRMAIKSALVDKLIAIHGGISRPSITEVRALCTELEFSYPTMFKEDDGTGGYGLGGTLGSTGLANQVLDAMRKKDGIGGDLGRTGKRKMIYGVNREKFLGARINKEAATLFRQANDKTVGYEEREKIYEENRSDLQAEFFISKKAISHVCRGFWKDWKHVANHFKYLTGTPDDLSVAVEENFIQEMNNLKMYLSCVSKEVDYQNKMEEIELKCASEYGGSRLFRDIMITRLAGDKLDKSGANLIRLESDGPAALTASPHLLAVCVDKTWVFEVYVDKMKLLGNLSFPQAIASFLHIAFVFNLEYPKESQTVADIWQRRFARYGTNTGTRTGSKKEVAQTKMKKYKMVLGILG